MDLWKELGIEPTHDPRVIRRAYAVKLKIIDQATQPERFEQLRAAYAYALVLAERNASAQGQGATDEHPLLLEGGSEPVAEPAPASESTSARTQIGAVYAYVLEGAETQTTEQLSSRLSGALDGVLDLKTREELELLVLNDVFTPRPFRERLMAAAAKSFGWSESLAHLAERSFDAAREMHIWLEERAALEAGTASQGWQLSQPLTLAVHYYSVRERGAPLDDEARIVEAIQFMQRAFPTVLRYRLDAEIVDYWLERGDHVEGETLKQAALQNIPPQKTARRGGMRWWAVMILISAMASIVNNINRPQHYTQPAPRPAYDLRTFESGCDQLQAVSRAKGYLTTEQSQVLQAQCQAQRGPARDHSEA